MKYDINISIDDFKKFVIEIVQEDYKIKINNEDIEFKAIVDDTGNFVSGTIFINLNKE